MFLWTRPWTTQVLVALLTSKTPSPGLTEWVVEALCINCGIVLPGSILLGQICIRLAASVKLPKAVRSVIPRGIWTLLIQCLFGDFILFLLLWSVEGKIDIDIIKHSTTTSSSANEESSNGLDIDWSQSSGPFLIFALRLLVTLVGVAIGERFFPLVLTGGIACGKSTVSKLLSEKANFHMIDADKIGHQILLPPWHESLQEVGSLVKPTDSVYEQILETFSENNNSDNKTNKEETEHDKSGKTKHTLIGDDQCIDRAKLGARIFGNPADRKKLNAITHPRIFYCLIKNIIAVLYSFDIREQQQQQQQHSRQEEAVVGGHIPHNQTFVCAEVPLLFESGALRYIFGLVMVVACSEGQQFERLRKRNPELPVEECRKRIESQLSMTEKVRRADVVLWNDKDDQSMHKAKALKQTEEDDSTKRKDNVHTSAQSMALSQQVEKAVRIIEMRMRGAMGTTLAQLLFLLSGSIIASACYKLYMGLDIIV